MLKEKFIKSLSRKNHDFKMIENHNWDLGFEKDVHFMYFTYVDTKNKINHIILLATNLSDSVRYEFITQDKFREEDTQEIIDTLEQELKKELAKNPDYAHKKVIEGMDKEKYIGIIEQDEYTSKRMQRYIKKKKPEEENEVSTQKENSLEKE